MSNAFQRTMQRVARGLFGINFGTPGAETFEEARRFNSGLALWRGEELQEPYRQHPTIAIAIGTIAEDAASVPWELYPEDGEDALESHPVLDLWARPNKSMTGLQLWAGTYIAYHLFGEAFWYYPDVVLGRPGAPAAANAIAALGRNGIMLLDPRSVVHKETGSGIEWAIRGESQQDIPLDVARLTHFKRFNPYHPVRGLSKIEAILAEAKGDYEASRWNERFFSDQNGIPSGVLIPGVGSNPTPDQRNEIHRTWNQKHGGTKRSVAILPAAWKFEDFGVSHRDMDFKALREYSREQILAMFGLPPFYGGVLDKANYANAREQKEVYWHGTIHRFLRDIRGVLNHDFMPKLGVEGLQADSNWEVINALTENLDEKSDVAGKLFALGFTKRQINERLDLGFDVDELEDADVGYLPFNLAPVALLSEPRTPAGSTETDTDEDDEDDETEEETEAAKAYRRLHQGTDEMREQRRTLVWKNLVARTRDIETRFDKTVRSHVRGLGDEVLANLNSIKGWLAQHKQDGPVADLLFNVDEAKRKLVRQTAPIHRQAFKRGGESLLADVGIGIAFDLSDPVALAKLAELSHKIKRIDDTLEHALRVSLIDGVQGHETVEELAKRVNHVIDVAMHRSRSIARTETGYAFNGGRHQSMRQAGIKKQEWLSSRDPDVRDSHTIDREVVSIGEPFSNGLYYPNDPSGPPGEIINCRCVALPVVED